MGLALNVVSYAGEVVLTIGVAKPGGGLKQLGLLKLKLGSFVFRLSSS